MPIDQNGAAPSAPTDVQLGSLADLIKYTDETDYHRLILVYSKPGVGKTYLLGTTLAAGKKVLVLDCDLGGSETLDQLHVPYIRVETFSEFSNICTQLKAGGADEYDVIGIDTGTGLQTGLIQEIEAERPGIDNRQLYGEVLRRMRYELYELRKQNVAIVVTAHEREDFIGDGDARRLSKVTPGFSPGVTEGLNRIASVVCRLTLRQRDDPQEGESPWVRVLQFQEMPIYQTKSRSGNFPAAMVEPTMGKILAALEGR